jgi:hypothetical protein
VSIVTRPTLNQSGVVARTVQKTHDDVGLPRTFLGDVWNAPPSLSPRRDQGSGDKNAALGDGVHAKGDQMEDSLLVVISGI